jgi:hypothetical protein
MQFQLFNPIAIVVSELPSHEQFTWSEIEVSSEQLEVATPEMSFETHFEGCMEMYSPLQVVEEYLQAHEGWFCRCAQPMKAEPLGENGYILTVGHFGSFGYEVEPKIAVILQPPSEGIYNMNTVPVPDYTPPGYNADYQASMSLEEVPANEATEGLEAVYRKQKRSDLPEVITKVRWELHLKVQIRFPQFIYKLPLSFLQNTGDRVLTEIIRQISPRLTYKVQGDFHERFHLPLPPKSGRKFNYIEKPKVQGFIS